MIDITPPILGMIALACLLTGLSKGGLGGTLGALITPLLALVMPLSLAIGLILPILMVGDVFAVAAHWKRWEWRVVWVLLAGALVGVGLGTVFIAGVSPQVLRRTLGALVLLFAIYRLLETRLKKDLHSQPPGWVGILAGAVAGFTSTIASAGGPPVAVYLLMLNMAPTTFVATTALFFTILNWIKVPYYLSAGILKLDLSLQLAWLLPLVPLGVWAGKRLVTHINRLIFERLVLALLLISAFLLLFR
ncbi:MAG: sulfite exporter TauE/SafE family protein [Anaerolineales bacterium]|nr:sulfite exporter TauE/SafE family protein [Anaerolineales bacterium]